MKIKTLVTITVMSTLLLACSSIKTSAPDQNQPSPYLGQATPGLTAKVFAPGKVSSEHKDLSGFFSPDMTEFYFTRQDTATKQWALLSYKLDNGNWRQAMSVPRVGRPFISPNGELMHLGKKYQKRTSNGWSKVQSLGSPYEEIRIMRLTSSRKGTYVFDEATREGNGLLRYSSLINGKRQEPKPLGKNINTGKWNAHPFIAPDESYILWDGERANGFGGNDIYVSFKQSDGTWGEAINLGNKVNTKAEESGAYVTPDGKYLFFNSNSSATNRDIFWIDAKVIEMLRP